MRLILGAEEKETVYCVICRYCGKVFKLTKKDLILRNMKGIPVNSFYCALCKRRNFFF